MRERNDQAVRFDIELRAELRDLVDSTVLPAVIDLRQKLETEKKQWVRRILSPIQKGLRLIVGNPPVTQAQLMSNALVLSADVATSVANDLAAVEALKRESGLTFLVEVAGLLKEPAG